MKLIGNKEGWKRVRLDDVVVRREENDKANAQSRFDAFVKVDHMQAGSLHLKGVGSQKDEKLPPTFYKIFRKGQILFPTRNPHLRRTALAHCDGICGEKTLTLEVNEEVADTRFIPFLFHSAAFYDHTASAIIGSTNPHCRWRDVGNYGFLLPPKGQQAKLAELLWAADNLVEAQVLALQRIEELTNVYRSEVFSRSNWPRKRLRELFAVQLGKMLSPKAKQGANPFPYLANANVQWDSFDLEKLNKMDFSEKDQEKFSLQYGDLLVCEGGEVGRSAVWRNEIHPCFYQKAIHRLRPLTELSSEVMLQFMIWAKTAGLFTGHTGHSTIAHLTAVMLKELKVPVPPKEEIREIEGQFSQFKESTAKCSEALVQSRMLLKSVTNRVF